MSTSGKSHLHTTPGTQLQFAGSWCAGHRWADRGRVAWWVHHAGHRLGLLRNKRPKLAYLEGKAADE